MTTFEDGPAFGQTLSLWRAPLFLRVVVDRHGKLDALDQPDDFPSPDERIYAYVLTAPPGWMHVRAGRGGGGVYTHGNYRLVDPQPSHETMADKAVWGAWCGATAVIPEFAREAVKRGSWM